MSIFNRAKLTRVTGFSSRFGTELASSAVRVPFREWHAEIEAPIERRVMSRIIKKMSRRTLVQVLIALPALSLFRNQPAVVDPDGIVEVNGWILKRSDLA